MAATGESECQRQEQVLEALKKVKFPGLSRDIVSFGFVRDVVVDGGAVSFTVHFQTENPAVGQQIARDADAAVRALEGVRDVRVNLEIGAKTGIGQRRRRCRRSRTRSKA